MPDRIGNRRGFTLVELMIVVAIIGALAAIAIPNYLLFQMKARTSEAKANLGAIRSAEVAYFAEWSFYVADTYFIPRNWPLLDGTKAPWNPGTHFSIIGFAPEGAVYYTYGLHSNPVGEYAKKFSAMAWGDLDDNVVNITDLSAYQITNTSQEIQHNPPAWTTSGEF
jgi:type IV pilus assembly protein PilA